MDSYVIKLSNMLAFEVGMDSKFYKYLPLALTRRRVLWMYQSASPPYLTHACLPPTSRRRVLWTHSPKWLSPDATGPMGACRLTTQPRTDPRLQVGEAWLEGTMRSWGGGA